MYNVSNKDDLKKLLSQKEFFSLKIGPKKKFQLSLSENEKDDLKKYYNESLNMLSLYSYQRFLTRYVNIFSKVKRIAVKWGTGSGKSKGSLSLANRFLKDGGQRVYIVGLTKSIFVNELIKDPHLGIITQPIIDELKYLKKIGSMKEYLYQLNKVKKYINVKGYRFIGYKKLFNKLFIFPEKFIYESLSLKNVKKLVQEKIIGINYELLNDLENSLIILDESHKLYNSKEKNNWGLALEYILDHLKDNIYCVLLSATLLNNDPSEIVEIASILDHSFKGKKEDYFDVNDGVFVLKKNALNKLSKYFYGKISYLETRDPLLYPKQYFMGVKTKIHNKVIPYLKFISCEMVDQQLKIYNEIYNKSFPINGKFVNDMVLDNGIYKKNEIKRFLTDNNNIKNVDPGYFTISRPSSLKNATKYKKMLSLLIESRKGLLQGKTIIYHKHINVTGVIYIGEILRYNGYVEYGNLPKDDSICLKCDKKMKTHGKEHDFVPIVYFIFAGFVSVTKRNDIANLFNESLRGENMAILIGSSIIEESWDFKGVKHLMVMSPTKNPTKLIQLFGRINRSRSHLSLPVDERETRIYILVSVAKNSSYELEQYYKMMQNYTVIKEINNMLNKGAIDLFINEDIINNDGNPLGDDPVKSHMKISSYNTDYFDILYRDEEITSIESIIKSLFTKAPVWKYNDLFNAVKNFPVNVQYNTTLIQEKNFIIGLNNIVSVPHRLQFTLIENNIITKKGEYYILTKKNFSTYYNFLSSHKSQIKPINITNELDITIKFSVLKEEFYRENRDLSIMKLSFNLYKYNRTFHIRMCEEIIEYLFSILNGEKPSERHNFMLRILYFYDRFNLILYASQIGKNTYDEYIDSDKGDSNLNFKTLMFSSLSNVTSVHPVFDKFNILLEKKKVEARILPVGHFLDKRAKVFDLKEWSYYYFKRENPKYKENNIIIGYLNRGNKITFEFKIREPETESYLDKRREKRGNKCSTIPKSDLIRLAVKLNIDINNSNVNNLCTLIKHNLIKRELQEAHKRESIRIKWFYFHFEEKPWSK